MKYLILIIFFLGVSCGRQRETDLVLDNARALMRDEPARALALLRTLRTEHLKRASSRAQYALLYSQALDKNRIFRTDDSLIRIAVRYYESRDTPHEKASAYYYLGRIYDNRCDKIGAAEALFHAQAHVSETDDDYLKGQIAQHRSALQQPTQLRRGARLPQTEQPAFPQSRTEAQYGHFARMAGACLPQSAR